MSTQLAVYNFPDTYSTLVSGYTGTVKYISSIGSNSNNGDSATTPYLTIDYAITQNSATARVMFVVMAGTYTMTAVSGTSSSASVAIRDGGTNERVYVCCPGQTIIQWTANTGDRDCVMVDFGNTASAIYGGILKRNNNARSGNYVVSFFKMTTKGTMYNTVFQETNSNNSWSWQYDNYGYNNFTVNNCTIYNSAAPSGNYSNAGTCVINNTVFNTACTTGGTETGVLKSQTVNSSTYVTTGVTTAGVYSGTYAWNGTITSTGISPTSTATSEGSTIVLTYSTLTTTGTTVNYYITGTNITSNDIGGTSLTGTLTVPSTTASFGTAILSLTLSNDLAMEGTEIMYVSIGPFTSVITIYDTSAPLTISPPTGPAGTAFVVTLSTSSSNNTVIPYVITGSGITSYNIASTTGNFIVSSGSANFTLYTSTVPGATFYVSIPSIGIQQSGVITYTSTTAYPVVSPYDTAVPVNQTGLLPVSAILSGQTPPAIPLNTSTINSTGYFSVSALSGTQAPIAIPISTYGVDLTGILPVTTFQGSYSATVVTSIGLPVGTTFGALAIIPLGQPLVKEWWI